MKFEIKNRWTGNVQFECELDDEITKKAYSFRLGFAIKAAIKSGADLGGAYLRGAYLRGADFYGAGKLIGGRPILIVGNIGSNDAYLQAYSTENGIYIKRGCFFGSLKEFTAAVKEKHKGTVYFDEYNNAISFIKKHFKIWNK